MSDELRPDEPYAPPQSPPPPPPPRDREVWLGVALALLLHAVCVPLACWLAAALGSGSLDGLVPLMFWGLLQVVYLLPTYVILRRKGRPGRARGVLLCALGSFLLWGSCIGLPFLG